LAKRVATESPEKRSPGKLYAWLWKNSISRESGWLEENAISQDVQYVTISCWGGQETPKNHPEMVMVGFFYSLVRQQDFE